MTYLDTQAPIRRIWPAVVAGISLLVASALSVGGLNVFGAFVSFGFLPLVIIAIWPRQANALLSLLFLFWAGIFTDWATASIIGQWALVYVVIWGVLRPELRSAPFSPASLLIFWSATCGLSVVLLSVTGWFVYGVRPDLGALGRQAILATLVLPVIALMRGVVSRRFSDNEEWER